MKVKTVIKFYFLLPDFKSRGHPIHALNHFSRSVLVIRIINSIRRYIFVVITVYNQDVQVVQYNDSLKFKISHSLCWIIKHVFSIYTNITFICLNDYEIGCVWLRYWSPAQVFAILQFKSCRTYFYSRIIDQKTRSMMT